ncbi:MAG: hypothetical protein QOJ53_2152 [Sphingomonadales bacterium]|jgi:hypothetical protein|nr:hypothetical protein [Sphingomonadales bacterium]
MITAVIALALQAAPAPAPPAPPDPCQVDTRAMLALGMDAFDQDMTGGWRAVSHRPGCDARAAGLIRDYRTFLEQRLPILYWHEAQLRAALGETEVAIVLMERSRRRGDENGWNAYVDASIAFLRGDRPALTAARARLAGLPRPADFEEQTLPSGYRTRWPPNLDVVDGLIRCFGRPYRNAYAPECRAAEAANERR